MSVFEFAVKFFQDSGLAIYPSILIMALGLAIAIPAATSASESISRKSSTKRKRARTSSPIRSVSKSASTAR